jgi:hypothetical protein
MRENQAVIANSTNGLISGVDTAGRVLFSTGRRGREPGEFRSIRALFGEDTAFWAYDNVLGRLTRFSIDGKLLKTVEVPIPPAEDSLYGPAHLVATRQDTMLFEHVRLPKNLDGVMAPEITLVSRVRGRIIGSLGPLVGSPSYFRRRPGSVRAMPLPFARRLLVVPLGDAIGIVDTEHPEVRVFGFELRLRSVIRFRIPRDAVTPEDLRMYADSVVQQYDDREVRVATRLDIQRRPASAFHPAITAVHGTSTGELWILPRVASAGDVPFVVLSSDRQLCCTVSVPTGSALLDASARAMLLRSGKSKRAQIALWLDTSQAVAPRR